MFVEPNPPTFAAAVVFCLLLGFAVGIWTEQQNTCAGRPLDWKFSEDDVIEYDGRTWVVWGRLHSIDGGYHAYWLSDGDNYHGDIMDKRDVELRGEKTGERDR